MAQLTSRAREDFEDAGIDVEELAKSIWGQPEWRGDACGCTDDRCIGHHHDGSHCGCRPVIIQNRRDELAAAAQAEALWARFVAASGDELSGVRRDAAAWVETFHPAAPSWSLDEVVDGRRGITVTSFYNDLHHLVWMAPGS